MYLFLMAFTLAENEQLAGEGNEFLFNHRSLGSNVAHICVSPHDPADLGKIFACSILEDEHNVTSYLSFARFKTEISLNEEQRILTLIS